MSRKCLKILRKESHVLLCYWPKCRSGSPLKYNGSKPSSCRQGNWIYHANQRLMKDTDVKQTLRLERHEMQKQNKRWRLKRRICYFEFLLTGPAGRAINNLVQYLTWDLVPGGCILARFDAERASFPKPLYPSVPLFSLSASTGVIFMLIFFS